MTRVAQEIKQLLTRARANVARQVNGEPLKTYWSIGKSSVTMSSLLRIVRITESKP